MKVIKLRRFLYLNTNSLYSYISQINDGLPTNTTKTNKISKESKDNLIDENYLNRNDYAFSTENKLYDEAFDKLKKHLDSNNIIKKEKHIIGDFLEMNDEMFIVDLEYYKNIFSNDDILEYAKKDDVEKKVGKELEKYSNVDININKMNYDKTKIEKEIRKQVDLEYKEIKKMLNIILNVVPYNKFGIMGDCLIVLDDEFFRDKNNVVAYKYGGKMTMLGYLTNIVNNKIDDDNDNVFKSFPIIINSFMLSFFKKNEIKIVHPIAIYY